MLSLHQITSMQARTTTRALAARQHDRMWLSGAVPGSRWTSFVADPERRRILHEDGNDGHRLRVEHDRARLYVELSGEDGAGPWTVMAVDRASRRYAVAQAATKRDATEDAARALDHLLDR